MPTSLCIPTYINILTYLHQHTYLYQHTYLPMTTYQHIPIYVNLPAPTNLHQHTYLTISTHLCLLTNTYQPMSTYLPTCTNPKISIFNLRRPASRYRSWQGIFEQVCKMECGRERHRSPQVKATFGCNWKPSDNRVGSIYLEIESSTQWPSAINNCVFWIHVWFIEVIDMLKSFEITKSDGETSLLSTKQFQS